MKTVILLILAIALTACIGSVETIAPDAPEPTCSVATPKQTEAYRAAKRAALACAITGGERDNAAIAAVDSDPDPLAGVCDPAASVVWAECVRDACGPGDCGPDPSELR